MRDSCTLCRAAHITGTGLMEDISCFESFSPCGLNFFKKNWELQLIVPLSTFPRRGGQSQRMSRTKEEASYYGTLP